MAKRLTDEDRIVAMIQYNDLDRAQSLINLANALMRQRVAAERPKPRKRKAETEQATG